MSVYWMAFGLAGIISSMSHTMTYAQPVSTNPHQLGSCCMNCFAMGFYFWSFNMPSPSISLKRFNSRVYLYNEMAYDKINKSHPVLEFLKWDNLQERSLFQLPFPKKDQP
jgi:hypothetical protein